MSTDPVGEPPHAAARLGAISEFNDQLEEIHTTLKP
jgi:hypothetical protein